MGIGDLLSIITHIKKWVVNLRRAKAARKNQSIDALKAVVLAVRETTFYLREIRDQDEQSIETEKKLTRLWTELSFEVANLKLEKLRKSCKELGKFWSDPKIYSFNKIKDSFQEREKDFEFLRKRLQDIERSAEDILKKLI
ncbi:MAG: hypothetical protein GF421_11240 [Candidatus Aminicenantes bacterium]|nr:hypothetical protein [Candidatus Aminicenantes bacterium]